MREKRKLKRRYNSTSSFYDERYEDIQKRKFRTIKEEIKKAERVLDVGCGTGLFLREISTQASFVVGVDFSFNMLKEAKKRFEGAGLVSADADNLPFLDGSFDLVVSLTLLQNMPYPERTILEMFRVTMPGGKVIVTSLKKKYSVDRIRDCMISAGLEILRFGEIPDSEDFLCIGRRKK